MLTYKILLTYLKKQKKFKINIKKDYCVLTLSHNYNIAINNNISKHYHITIYQNQWDDYEKETGFSYHLFHISSNNESNKCSSYFWVDTKKYLIRTIPSKYFKYEQENFDFHNSTRKPCNLNELKLITNTFQKILSQIKNYTKN